MNTFLNIFHYEMAEVLPDSSTMYINCKFMRDFGTIKAGQVLDNVSINLNILGWMEEELVYDETTVV